MERAPSQIALRVVNHISAMVAYWDSEQRCVFSNDAYLEWFGKTPEQMVGMSLKELLGPLYDKNLPYILAALKGEKQVFERRIPLPHDGYRDTIATYTPDVVDGKILGFSVHVADVTLLREREASLEKVLREKEEILAQVRELTGLLPVCAWCRKIKNDDGYWFQFEDYVKRHSKAEFTHGICPDCRGKLKT
ncbi:MAG: diguanylate cyclase/phosphodiesterase & domain with sensor(s) [Holophagaceae bacterium]|nr:diguanylate cyclase/phosphodiesterase & domain with sensor(s) [Holophagaceae bacterium]